jgi:DNA repair/transcription protein MET18/MMS19
VQHIDRYFSVFSDPQIGRDAAKALGTLGTGGESILIKANYAILRVSAYNNLPGLLLTVHPQLLHIQKFFNSTLPLILAGYQTSAGMHLSLLIHRIFDAYCPSPIDSGEQTTYLIALASLVKSVPKSIYAHELPKVSLSS